MAKGLGSSQRGPGSNPSLAKVSVLSEPSLTSQGQCWPHLTGLR